MTGEQLKKHHASYYAIRTEGQEMQRISIGFQLVCLITFAFYCVKGKKNENGR